MYQRSLCPDSWDLIRLKRVISDIRQSVNRPWTFPTLFILSCRHLYGSLQILTHQLGHTGQDVCDGRQLLLYAHMHIHRNVTEAWDLHEPGVLHQHTNTDIRQTLHLSTSVTTLTINNNTPPPPKKKQQPLYHQKKSWKQAFFFYIITWIHVKIICFIRKWGIFLLFFLF